MKASFRNGVVTTVAIVIAYAIAGAKKNYSSQQNIVTGMMVGCLLQAYVFIMSLGSWKALKRHYLIFWITLGLLNWLLYGKLTRTPDCVGQWYFTSETILQELRTAWYVVYVIAGVVSVAPPVLRDSKTYGENKRLIKLTFVFSILMWITSLGLVSQCANWRCLHLYMLSLMVTFII